MHCRLSTYLRTKVLMWLKNYGKSGAGLAGLPYSGALDSWSSEFLMPNLLIESATNQK